MKTKKKEFGVCGYNENTKAADIKYGNYYGLNTLDFVQKLDFKEGGKKCLYKLNMKKM